MKKRELLKIIKIAIFGSLILGAGLGFGSVISFMALQHNHPSIITETKWKTITTSPASTYSPETPWHLDPAVVTNTIPTTTTATARPVPAPTTTTTMQKLPPSTLPPSSTTLTSGTLSTITTLVPATTTTTEKKTTTTTTQPVATTQPPTTTSTTVL